MESQLTEALGEASGAESRRNLQAVTESLLKAECDQLTMKTSRCPVSGGAPHCNEFSLRNPTCASSRRKDSDLCEIHSQTSVFLTKACTRRATLTRASSDPSQNSQTAGAPPSFLSHLGGKEKRLRNSAECHIPGDLATEKI